jgi:hypothetical protein
VAIEAEVSLVDIKLVAPKARCWLLPELPTIRELIATRAFIITESQSLRQADANGTSVPLPEDQPSIDYEQQHPKAG